MAEALDMSAEAIAERAAARRKRGILVRKFEGMDPGTDDWTYLRELTAEQRMEMTCLLSRRCRSIPVHGRVRRRLPRSDWPVRLTRG